MTIVNVFRGFVDKASLSTDLCSNFVMWQAYEVGEIMNRVTG